MSRTWPRLIAALLAGKDLTTGDTEWAMRQLMQGGAEPVHLAGFLVALRAKGETAQEVAGLVAAVMSEAVDLDVDRDAVDIVGTGGDQAGTVNISTMASIVAAGAGVPVVKHGGRSVSSRSGAADVLEALGLPLDLPPAAVATCVREVGIGFVFAPRFHAGLRHAAPIRRALGVPTVINYIAPLVNPGLPRAGCIGCADAGMAPVLGQVLADRGSTALVVRGHDGLDEISTAAPTQVWIADAGSLRETTFDVLDLGIARSGPGDLSGGDASHNAAVVHDLLAGKRGPIRDAVLVNAAAAIAAFRGVSAGLRQALAEGLTAAAASLDSGRARDTLTRWVQHAQAATRPHG